MSYATSLLTTYPPYDPPSLFSDGLVTRSNFDNLYPPSVPYLNNSRLLSDDLAYNTATYHPPLYPLSNPTSVFPTKKFYNSPTRNWHQSNPQNESFSLSNDITEYSDSLGTASNTNTASSVARSINENNRNGSKHMFSNSEQNHNDENQYFQSAWNSPKITKKGQKKVTKQIQPPPNKFNEDSTPIQSPLNVENQTNHFQRNDPLSKIEKQSTPIDIQAWLNESKKTTPIPETEAEKAWSVKINQLQMTQAQHEKDKTKSSRALPSGPKKFDNKSILNKSKSMNEPKSRETINHQQNDSYFDSLFDGDFFRKPSTTSFNISSSFHQPTMTKTKFLTNSINNSSSTTAKSSKNSQRKINRYEPPPATKRVQPAITTSSWRKQPPIPYHYDSLYPYYFHEEFLRREFIHKDTDERYREALLKLRADRAEQKQKDNETTAKRLNYGDYVRRSTKDELLQNAVKPSPWSDFMDLKKGNLYSLSQEEKKQLYKQSKSYGERVRFRNFTKHQSDDGSRGRRHSLPLTDDMQEYDSGNETLRQINNNSKSGSRTSRRPDSGSTTKTGNKINIKQSNQNSRATNRTEPSISYRKSDIEDGNLSDYDRNSNKFSKKKSVHYAKFDSSGRATSGTDDSDNENSNQRRRINEDLFTLREEKTLESIEGVRYKKR